MKQVILDQQNNIVYPNQTMGYKLYLLELNGKFYLLSNISFCPIRYAFISMSQRAWCNDGDFGSIRSAVESALRVLPECRIYEFSSLKELCEFIIKRFKETNQA